MKITILKLNPNQQKKHMLTEKLSIYFKNLIYDNNFLKINVIIIRIRIFFYLGIKTQK